MKKILIAIGIIACVIIVLVGGTLLYLFLSDHERAQPGITREIGDGVIMLLDPTGITITGKYNVAHNILIGPGSNVDWEQQIEKNRGIENPYIKILLDGKNINPNNESKGSYLTSETHNSSYFEVQSNCTWIVKIYKPYNPQQ
jgi:hypothetical protein